MFKQIHDNKFNAKWFIRHLNENTFLQFPQNVWVSKRSGRRLSRRAVACSETETLKWPRIVIWQRPQFMRTFSAVITDVQI